MSNYADLEARNVTLQGPSGASILDDISFDLPKGSFTCLLGRNGSGKSMLMKTLKGLQQPSSGSITIHQEDLSRFPHKRNTLIGLVFQDADTQVVGQSVQRDILFGLENLKVEKEQQKQTLDEVSELLHLTHLLHRRPRTLSGGEKRRLAIAGVLVMKPQVLMLDEPFANLDYEGITQVLSSLVTLKESGQTIVVATHEIEKIYAYADQAILLDQGSLVIASDPLDVLERIEQYGLRRPPLSLSEMTWLK
ncbi:MAG: energy-coupling factor ABC transporter ATP-binding protein [Sphaerochaetaceae bacterium]|jgi:biotin transport system ATP-binding protein